MSELWDEKLLESPCPFCGYDGSGYWVERTHASACPYYSMRGKAARRDLVIPFLIDIVKQYIEGVAKAEREEDNVDK
jgi:hypothetical protein